MPSSSSSKGTTTMTGPKISRGPRACRSGTRPTGWGRRNIPFRDARVDGRRPRRRHPRPGPRRSWTRSDHCGRPEMTGPTTVAGRAGHPLAACRPPGPGRPPVPGRQTVDHDPGRGGADLPGVEGPDAGDRRMAVGRSASARTKAAPLPPSSISRRFMVLPPASKIREPTTVLPVKLIMSTRGSRPAPRRSRGATGHQVDHPGREPHLVEHPHHLDDAQWVLGGGLDDDGVPHGQRRADLAGHAGEWEVVGRDAADHAHRLPGGMAPSRVPRRQLATPSTRLAATVCPSRQGQVGVLVQSVKQPGTWAPSATAGGARSRPAPAGPAPGVPDPTVSGGPEQGGAFLAVRDHDANACLAAAAAAATSSTVASGASPTTSSVAGLTI